MVSKEKMEYGFLFNLSDEAKFVDFLKEVKPDAFKDKERAERV